MNEDNVHIARCEASCQRCFSVNLNHSGRIFHIVTDTSIHGRIINTMKPVKFQSVSDASHYGWSSAVSPKAAMQNILHRATADVFLIFSLRGRDVRSGVLTLISEGVHAYTKLEDGLVIPFEINSGEKAPAPSEFREWILVPSIPRCNPGVHRVGCVEGRALSVVLGPVRQIDLREGAVTVLAGPSASVLKKCLPLWKGSSPLMPGRVRGVVEYSRPKAQLMTSILEMGSSLFYYFAVARIQQSWTLDVVYTLYRVTEKVDVTG
ncbi:hypothetical protein IW262DRAFT_1302662 [Armillaria fumosa]|nr:hypothetical protein IW262DRAFT_1302662 [Armillaria fumosa]